ncbi:Protein of unknown function [Peptostreptococcaceae bacterium pGA-8]|nr:Protein of unknown function [Peptostreptococcaceae bacterium pGA-8]
MNEIIDVEFKEITDFSNRSTEELTAEANALWEQMEAIGNLGLMMAVKAGMRLIEIKNRVPHGSWEDWVDKNCKFSKRKASNMIKLAEKSRGNDSIFSNRQTFADLGISKVWELLSTTEEVAETVLENENLEDMTVKELREEIRVTKAAYDRIEADRREIEAEAKRAKAEILELKKQLEGPATRSESTEALEAELKELQEKLEKKEQEIKDAKAKQKELIKKEKDKLLAEKEHAKMEAKAEAEKSFKDELESKRAEDRKRIETLEEELAKAEKKLSASGNEKLLQIKIHAETIQNSFDKIKETIEQTEPETAEKMKNFIRAVLDKVKGEL